MKKKKFFYLFALLCTVSLLTFTACSDDEDDTWKQIPQTEISGEQAVMTLNGAEITEGAVQMKVENESMGELTLRNIIPNYDELKVAVELQKQADESFLFAGTASVVGNYVMTREDMSLPPSLTVEVSGTIYLDGKVTVNVKADGAILHLGTYTGSTLSLNYSGSPLIGKTVVYSLQEGVPVLTLVGIVPGELTVPLIGVYTDNGVFQGETALNGTAVKAEGTFQNGVLVLNVNVKLSEAAQGGLAGEWPLAKTIATLDEWGFEIAYNDYAPVRIIWTPIDETEKNGQNISALGTLFVSHLLAEVINSITLTDDGNLTASYYPEMITGQDAEGNPLDMQTWMMSKLGAKETAPVESKWLTSPKNLMHWYAKDGLVYLVPNLPQILMQAAADQGESLDIESIMALLQMVNEMDDATLGATLAALGQQMGIDPAILQALDVKLIREVLGWMTTGVPLKYTVTAEGAMRLYADKDMVSPFMPILLSFLPQLQAAFDEAVAADETGMLQLVMAMLGLEKFTDLNDVWYKNTDQFAVGLGFQR